MDDIVKVVGAVVATAVAVYVVVTIADELRRQQQSVR